MSAYNAGGSGSGGVGNAFFQVAGPAGTVKTFTFPNANSTVVTGTGTAGKIPKTSGAGTQNDSFIVQNATGIHVSGTLTPNATNKDFEVLDVGGDGNIQVAIGGNAAGGSDPAYNSAEMFLLKQDSTIYAKLGYQTAALFGTSTFPEYLGHGNATVFGTDSAHDDIFVANSVEQVRLISGGVAPKFLQQALTAGTLNAETVAQARSTWHSYTWTNAMIVALGAVGNGDLTVCTLPAKTVVKNAYIVIITPDTSANALTVAFGRTGATFVDYIAASDAKAVANTVYGDVSGERGANLTGYDLPSYTATTDVKLHFIKTTTTLDTVLGSTGRVILETALVP